MCFYTYRYLQNGSAKARHYYRKPSRYETTSSDESPTKRRRSTTVATIGSGTIDEDIGDINRMLDENSTTLYNNTHMAHPHTQHTPQRTHANIQAHTNISYIGYIPEIQTNTTHAHTSPIMLQHPHNTPTQSFTLTTSANKSYYSNNTLPEFQESTRTWPMQEQDTRRDKNTHRENIGYGVGYSQETTQKTTEKRKEEDRFDRVEAELKRMNGLLQKILKCVQDHHSTP